jgi:SRSO17 transposase
MQVKWLEPDLVVSDEEQAWEFADQLENFLLEVGHLFPRADLRRRAAGCIRGLLGPVSRKNGWQLAEYAGWNHPWLQQHLLDRARWDADALRDFVRGYVLAGLADDHVGAGPSGSGVLVLDESGFPKRGHSSAGAAAQHCGTLGRVANCQVGVMAAWVTGAGQALIDRELYLPKEWTDDRVRCEAAHIPPEVGFATKPRLAEKIITRVLPELPESRVWVAADEVYGRDGAFRAFPEQHHLPYVVTVQANHTVLDRPGWRHIARLIERVAAEEDWVELPGSPTQLDAPAWQWWVRRLPDVDSQIGGETEPWARWVIARRRAEDPAERDYYLGWGPADTPVEELVYVPGARWRVEEAIRLAKSTCGLADYEVRSWHGWYRHITLAQAAVAFLAVQAAKAAREEGPLAPVLNADCGQGGGSALDMPPTAHRGGSCLSHQQHRPHRLHRL